MVNLYAHYLRRSGYEYAVIVDFHCHIITPGSRMPDADGPHYRRLLLPVPTEGRLGALTGDAVDTLAERLRTPAALRAYRRLSPVIYSEMSRRMQSADPNTLLSEMDKNGMSQAVVVAMDPFVPTPEVLDACAKHPDRLLPFGSCDPHNPDYAENFARLLTLPLAGLKFHSELQRLPLDSPKLAQMMTLLEASPKSHLPVYLHTGDFPIYPALETPWPAALRRLLTAFPALTFVCGHSGWDAPETALEIAQKHPKLLLETSWQPPETIRRLCDSLGPERLLLGSDFPLFSQGRALRNARAALTPAEFARVGSENARRLLGI